VYLDLWGALEHCGIECGVTVPLMLPKLDVHGTAHLPNFDPAALNGIM
jgi:hypothetical protein